MLLQLFSTSCSLKVRKAHKYAFHCHSWLTHYLIWFLRTLWKRQYIISIWQTMKLNPVSTIIQSGEPWESWCDFVLISSSASVMRLVGLLINWYSLSIRNKQIPKSFQGFQPKNLILVWTAIPNSFEIDHPDLDSDLALPFPIDVTLGKFLNLLES